MHSKLRLLLFADDLVLLSESPEALQSSINSLSKYCLKWSLQVNLTKTKVVCFSRQRTTMSHMFHLSGSPITIASEYKYLDVLLSANGSLKPAISILASQANKATFSLIKTSMHLGHPKPTTLLDTLVRPITEYGCEVWASDKAEEMEKVHKRFCKFALGLPTSACNAAVYGDLGRCPLENRRKIAMVKYSLVPSPTPSFSSLLSTSDEKLGVGLGTRLGKVLVTYFNTLGHPSIITGSVPTKLFVSSPVSGHRQSRQCSRTFGLRTRTFDLRMFCLRTQRSRMFCLLFERCVRSADAAFANDCTVFANAVFANVWSANVLSSFANVLSDVRERLIGECSLCERRVRECSVCCSRTFGLRTLRSRTFGLRTLRSRTFGLRTQCSRTRLVCLRTRMFGLRTLCERSANAAFANVWSANAAFADVRSLRGLRTQCSRTRRTQCSRTFGLRMFCLRTQRSLSAVRERLVCERSVRECSVCEHCVRERSVWNAVFANAFGLSANANVRSAIGMCTLFANFFENNGRF